jgi:Zinc finger, C3HC4 type (RING finger)
MDVDSDSDSDNRAAATSSRSNSRNKTIALASAEVASASSTSAKITRRKRLEKAKEESYASHIASLQNVEDLPSGWISATRAVKRRTNGKFRRPDEEPPITGYSWNNQHGVWVPSVRLVQETSFMSKITTKKVPSTSTSRKAPPSTAPINAPASRSRPFLKWSTTDESQVPSKITSNTEIDKKVLSRDARLLKSKTSSVAEIAIEPVARASRKRSTSHTNSDEKPPPRSTRRETKSIKLNVESDNPDEESSEDDVPINESNQDTVTIDISPTSENVKRKRRYRKKATDDTEDDDDNEFHPNSMWQEPYTDDLTLYERHRTARPVPTGTILFHMDAIRPEIRCAICLDILQNTRIVRECLHRFCESCIEQALTFQNVEAVGGRRKECPICRVYIPSRRSLAPDTYMDTLISRLLDNLIWEEDNDPAIYLRSPQKPKQGLRQQPSNSTTDDNTNVDNGTNEKDKKTGNISSTQLESRDNHSDEKVALQQQVKDFIPELIKVVLIQQADPITKKKQFDDLEQPYLTLTSDAPGSVVKAFICRKHGYSNTTNNVDGRTPHTLHDKDTTRSNRNGLLLWTMYRLEPYLINANDTLQYLILNRTDPFNGRYMPIYYRFTG